MLGPIYTTALAGARTSTRSGCVGGMLWWGSMHSAAPLPPHRLGIPHSACKGASS
jgi:hypothetical protein